MKKYVGVLLIIGWVFNISFSQIALDRTRLVFGHGSQESQSLVATNTGLSPLLAQAWIENDKGENIITPIVALPVLQRLNQGQGKHIKIQLMTKAVTDLPQDKESLFYLNILGVPTVENKDESGVNIIIQTRIKLFYRPPALGKYAKGNLWLRELIVKKSAQGITIDNITPFNIVIYAFDSGNGTEKIQNDIVIAPFQLEDIDLQLPGNHLTIYFISDEGALMAYAYSCEDRGKCQLIKISVDTMDGMIDMPHRL